MTLLCIGFGLMAFALAIIAPAAIVAWLLEWFKERIDE